MRLQGIVFSAAIAFAAALPCAAPAQDRAGSKDPGLLPECRASHQPYKDTQFDGHDFTVQKRTERRSSTSKAT